MPRSNGRHRNDVLNYLTGTGIGLAFVAAKPQVAPNRRCLAQEALPRAWMIDSLVSANRSALRESPQGGERDAGIFVGDDGGRGIARGYIRASARCYLAAQSRLANFQHCHQLEPGGGADQYRDLRRVEYNLNIIPTLRNNVDRNAAIQP